MKKNYFKYIPYIVFYFSLSIAFSNEQVATITQIIGTVNIFSNPSKEIKGNGPHVKFDDLYYHVNQAKVGDSVKRGAVLRTLPGGSAKLIYENGDQLNIGSASAYRISWPQKQKEATPPVQMDLMYGKIRGIFEKGGPRSKFSIRTKSAVMGVRGTDFFIGELGEKNDTQVTILRGSVNLQSRQANSKPVVIPSGFSAAIPQPVTHPKEQKKINPLKTNNTQQPISLFQSSKEELAEVVKTTSSSKKEGPQNIPPELQEKIKKLEKKAVVTTLNDIKKEDPKLFAKIEKNSLQSIDEINFLNVQEAIKIAPHAPPERRKARMSDFESLSIPNPYKEYVIPQETSE